MNFSKAMLNNAFKLIIAALVAALALRSVSMRFFFDYSTGFYTDSGLTAWLSLLIPLTLAAISCGEALCWLCSPPCPAGCWWSLP